MLLTSTTSSTQHERFGQVSRGGQTGGRDQVADSLRQMWRLRGSTPCGQFRAPGHRDSERTWGRRGAARLLQGLHTLRSVGRDVNRLPAVDLRRYCRDQRLTREIAAAGRLTVLELVQDLHLGVRLIAIPPTPGSIRVARNLQ